MFSSVIVCALAVSPAPVADVATCSSPDYVVELSHDEVVALRTVADVVALCGTRLPHRAAQVAAGAAPLIAREVARHDAGNGVRVEIRLTWRAWEAVVVRPR